MIPNNLTLFLWVRADGHPTASINFFEDSEMVRIQRVEMVDVYSGSHNPFEILINRNFSAEVARISIRRGSQIAHVYESFDDIEILNRDLAQWFREASE